MRFVLILYILFSFVSPVATLAHAPEFHQGASDALVITITDNGYMPQHPVVEVGVEVIFENKSTSAKWPASNFHPTHTEYPVQSDSDCLGSSFDACRPLAPGESWWFVFDKIGEWGFHDHLFPGMTGSITVVERNFLETPLTPQKNNNAVESFFIRLHTLLNNFIEPVQIFWHAPSASEFHTLSFDEQEMLITKKATYNARHAWEYLKEVGTYQQNAAVPAHEFAHIIGNALYTHFGFLGVEVCDETFTFGCFHGVTEEMFTELGPWALAKMKQDCQELFLINNQYETGYSGCMHGTGHGLATHFAYNLEPALKECETLGEPENWYCADGVYMEYTFSAPLTKEIGEAPWSLCSAATKSTETACARYVPSIFGKYLINNTHGGDVTRESIARGATQTCEKAPNTRTRERCVQSIGQMVAQNAIQEKISRVHTVCNYFDSVENIRNCIQAAANEYAFQNFLGWEEHTTYVCSHKDISSDVCVAGAKTVWELNHGS